jgi:ribosomal protein S18 acetylase RimI-like enzyme
VHSAGDTTAAYIEEVAVLETHQRQGIGSSLLQQTAER